MKISQFFRSFVAAAFLVPLSTGLFAFELTGHAWPAGTTVTMQLELGQTNVSLIDGLGTWNNSAADALALWNQHIDFVKLSWVLNSTAPKGSPDGYNSVLFSNTIFGEGFGEDTLAVTVIWFSSEDYTIETEADVVFNTTKTFNSYRGSQLPGSSDFHRVALHEFGHVLGLAHVFNDPRAQALMEPYITDLDHLAPDDIAGALFLYGYRITSPAYFTGFIQGSETSFLFSANNNPTSFTAVGLPPGLQLDPATGKVSGVPLQSGTFLVTVTAHGFPRDVSASTTIEVGAASITSSTNPAPFPVGSSFSYSITAANDPTSFSAEGLPPGLALDVKTGLISGVPTLSGYYVAPVVAHTPEYDAAGMVYFRVFPAYRPLVTQIYTPTNIVRTIKDPLRDRLYVLCDQHLVVINTIDLSVVTTISLGAQSQDMAMSIDGSKLWIVNSILHAVSLTDFSVLPDIPNGPFAGDTVREGANHKLYLGNASVVTQIDEITGMISPLLSAQYGISFGYFIETTPDGKTMILADKFGHPSLISRYDISGANPVFREQRYVTGYTSTLRMSPDGTLLGYTTDGDAVPGASFAFTLPTANLRSEPKTVDPLAHDGTLSFGSGHSNAYFGTVPDVSPQFFRLDFIDTASGVTTDQWTLGQGGVPAEDGHDVYLFIPSDGSVDVYSRKSGTLPEVVPAPKSLLNVSTRSVVGIDDNQMIAGFIINGDSAKELVFRALGPSLPLGATLANPTLSVYDSTGTVVATNNNWNQYRAEIMNAGFAPWDEHDAALVTTLQPGSYTVVVSIEDGVGGVGLVELYDLSSDNSGKIANISTRAKVETDDDILIGGFIVGGNEATKIIARAIGPSLASNNVNGVLLDPVLELHDGNGTVIDSNDNWRSTQQAEIIASGLSPQDDRESAIVATLQPGAYTAILRGQNNTTGVALVEIYNLDSVASATK